MITHQDAVLQAMQKLQENEFTKDILVPLFKARGFSRVEFYGGSSELGKDLVCWRYDELNEVELSVAQVKRYKPTKKASDSRSFSEIVTQICQCIETPLPFSDGNSYLPSSIYLVTPFAVDTQILATRFCKVSALKQWRVKIVDGPKLVALLEKHVPEIISRLLGGSHKIGKAIAPHLSNSVLMRALGFQAERHIRDFYTDIDFAVGYVHAKFLLSSSFSPRIERFEMNETDWFDLSQVLEQIRVEFGVPVVRESSKEVGKMFAAAKKRWERWKEVDRRLNKSVQDITFQEEELRAKIESDSQSALAGLKDEVAQTCQAELRELLDNIEKLATSSDVCVVGMTWLGKKTLADVNSYKAISLELLKAKKKVSAHQGKQPLQSIAVNADGTALSERLLEVRQHIQSETARLSQRKPTSKELRTFLEHCHRMFRITANILEDDIVDSVLGFETSDDLPEYTRLSLPVNVVFDTGLNVCVLGEAGAGKTTALQMYAYRHLESGNASKFVVFAPLAAVARQMLNKGAKSSGKEEHRLDQGIVDFIRSLGASYSIEEFKEGASAGGILLLDSIDEAYASAPWVIDSLASLAEAYPKLQLITSSRVSGAYVKDIPFVGVRLMPFTDLQQKAFLSNWFGRDAKNHVKVLCAHLERHSEVAEVVRNPLLATAMCALQEHNVPLPTSEIRLYQEWLGLLVGVYDTHKAVHRIKSPRHHLELLAQKLAFHLQVQGRREETRSNCEEVASKVLDHLMGPEEASGILGELMHPCNILVPMAWGDRWGFGHLRYQEYLAACELRNNRSLRVFQFVGSPWWKGVLMLFAQMHDSLEWIAEEIAEVPIDEIAKENLLAMLDAGPKRGRKELSHFVVEKQRLDKQIEAHLASIGNEY